jgi:hypothetical protein
MDDAARRRLLGQHSDFEHISLNVFAESDVSAPLFGRVAALLQHFPENLPDRRGVVFRHMPEGTPAAEFNKAYGVASNVGGLGAAVSRPALRALEMHAVPLCADGSPLTACLQPGCQRPLDLEVVKRHHPFFYTLREGPAKGFVYNAVCRGCSGNCGCDVVYTLSEVRRQCADGSYERRPYDLAHANPGVLPASPASLSSRPFCASLTPPLPARSVVSAEHRDRVRCGYPGVLPLRNVRFSFLFLYAHRAPVLRLGAFFAPSSLHLLRPCRDTLFPSYRGFCRFVNKINGCDSRWEGVEGAARSKLRSQRWAVNRLRFKEAFFRHEAIKFMQNEAPALLDAFDLSLPTEALLDSVRLPVVVFFAQLPPFPCSSV